MTRFPFAIDDTIVAAARANAVFALNLSGGKDSTMSAHAASAMLDELGHDRSRRLLIHADLGRAEWKSTPAMVERHAAEIGLPLVVVRRKAGDMVQRWEQRFEQGWELYDQMKLARLRSPWSSSSARFCTAELKRDSIHFHLAATYPGQTIVSVLGIRHQESPGRSKTPISKVDGKLRRANGTNGILWHPSIHVTTDQVFDYHHHHGLSLHEAYEVYGASRVSCALCVLASKSDLTISANVADNLDLYRHLVDIELRTGFSFQQGGWLADVAPHKLTDAQRVRLIDAKAYALRRREAEARIPKEFVDSWIAHKTPPMPVELSIAEAIAHARVVNASWANRPLSFLNAKEILEQFDVTASELSNVIK